MANRWVSFFCRLDALDDNAYAAFQASRNLRDVIDRVMENKAGGVPGLKKKLSVKASLMTPVLPMLVSEAWLYQLKIQTSSNIESLTNTERNFLYDFSVEIQTEVIYFDKKKNH